MCCGALAALLLLRPDLQGQPHIVHVRKRNCVEGCCARTLWTALALDVCSQAFQVHYYVVHCGVYSSRDDASAVTSLTCCEASYAQLHITAVYSSTP
jgi:hypothetical protein